ncbi:MAG: TetR/AcrR family transcriptional regulator [Hahellaceae bacterium]|nr:TetR/AcrR family transcriptional regulator [Hahellaceae bacterium]
MAESSPRSAGRRREILMAALDCFNEHGIQGATIEMIREKSGASVGSLYHHFGNKERIALALYTEGMRDYHQSLSEALAEATDTEQGIRQIVHTFVNWIANHPEWARFVFYSRTQVAAIDMDAEIHRDNQNYWKAIREWFSPRVKKREIKILPMECYSSVIMGPTQDYARRWLTGRASTDIREFADVFAQAAWDALKP